MIEPQSTTMPLPAAPAPTESSSSDGVGFGEMLAQSLGMTVDPAAVQQIAGEPKGNPFAGGNSDPAEGDPGTAVDQNPANLAPTHVADASEPARRDPAVQGMVVTPAPVATEQKDGVHPSVVAPLPSDPTTAPGFAESVFVPVPMVDQKDGIGLPLPTVPAMGDPTSESAPPAPIEQDALGEVKPIDGIAPPVPTTVSDHAVHEVDPANPRPATPPTIPNADPGASADTPAATKNPTLPTPPEPAAQPPAQANPVDPIAAGETGGKFAGPELVATQPKPGAPRPVADRGLPVTPELRSVAGETPLRDSPATRIAATPVAPRIDMSPVTQVEVMTPRSTVKIGEPPVTEQPISAPAAPAGNAATGGVPGSISAQSAVAPAVAAPVTHTALAERVMRAVELQANQPPPRTMVVDIPEIEGLRLVVSVRGGAQVHVVPTTGSATPDTFQPFMDDLSNVLAERGFEMTGEEHRQGRNQQDPNQEVVPFRLQRPTFRRPHPTDNDLRI